MKVLDAAVTNYYETYIKKENFATAVSEKHGGAGRTEIWAEQSRH